MFIFIWLFYLFSFLRHATCRSVSIAERDLSSILSPRADPPPPVQPAPPPTPLEGPAQGAPRDVYFLFDTRPGTMRTLSDGRTVFFTHTSILIAGTNNDPPLKIELAVDQKVASLMEGQFHLRVLDMGLGKDLQSTVARAGRTAVKLSTQTTLRNLAFFDPIQGTGIALDAFKADPQYRTGEAFKDRINDCNTYAKRIADTLKLEIPTQATDIFKASDGWQGRPGYMGAGSTMKVVAYLNTLPDGTTQNLQVWKNGAPCMRMGKRDASCGGGFVKEGDVIKGYTGAQTELALDKDMAGKVPPEALNLDVADTLNGKTTPEGKDLISTDIKTSTTMARVGSALKTFTAIGKEVFSALGIAGTFAGAAFVILDFINNDWVGGAIGLVGLAAGVAVGLAASGPVGWVIGGLIAALFAILPGLFKVEKPWAKKEDIQGIIQRKMFGDAEHTGNEQCIKGTADVPGNPDCQALYGAGTLSLALGLNNFDAIAFLVHFNDGYPITIKEMADAFSKDDKVATIECHNVPRGIGGWHNSQPTGDDPTVCVNPSFSIDRTKVSLPNLNRQASDVYDHVIPAKNGDCKLVSYPGTSNFPKYDISVSGLPSAIACGVTADTNGDGVWTGLESNTADQHSTDGQSGTYVKPPPETPFANLLVDEYPCISHDGDVNRMTCLPPGRYGPQSGTLVAVGTKDVNTLLLPKAPGWGLRTHWKGSIWSHPTSFHYRKERKARHLNNDYDGDEVLLPQVSAAVEVGGASEQEQLGGGSGLIKRVDPQPEDLNPDPTLIEHEWRTNQAATTYFVNDMDSINTNTDGVCYFEIMAPDDGPKPVCCLFSDVNFGGAVFCAGEGGGGVPDAWKNMAKSVSCHAGGQAWLYADSYGDAGGAKVQGDIKDLGSVPYGPDKNFALAVKAWWISRVQ